MQSVWICLVLAPLAVAADDASQRGPLQLSLKRAVEIATSPEGSAQVQLSAEALKQARARSGQARAALIASLSCGRMPTDRTRACTFRAVIQGHCSPI